MYIELGDEEKIEVEEIWSITECIICKKNLTLKNESYRSKLLPCLHAMCHKCFVRSCDKGELLCQCCSFSFNKEEIYDNKVLYEIVSDVDIPNTKNIVCSIHDAKVTHWCENCNEFICQDCVKHHGQLKSTRTHIIISKECYIGKLLAGTPKTAFPCDVHPKNELSIICHSCRAMTCRDCQLEHHKDHKYDFIVDKSESAKDELYNIFKKVEFHSIIMKAALSKITERESKIEELKKKIVIDIKKEFDVVRELLKKRENELMLSAIEKANFKLEECEKNRKSLKRNLNIIDHCLKFVKCVLFTSSDPVLFYTKDLMMNRMKRLHLVNRVPCAVDVINLSFSSENVDETKAKIKCCGAIKDCQDPTSYDKNYWNSIYKAIVSELRERCKAHEGSDNKHCLNKRQQELQDSGRQAGPEVSSDLKKEDHKVSGVPEKPNEHTRNSILRQDETNKEKVPVPQRDSIADTGSLTVQQQPSDILSLESLLRPSCAQQKKESQGNQDKSKLQAKDHSSWSNYSQAKSWHIPETVRLAPKPVDKDIGSGIKKVRIPAQNSSVIDLTDQPSANFEALDEILQDLGAFEERESRERENSREHQSPTGLPNDFWCSVCLGSVGLISCNNCPKVFHRDCHIPTIGFPVPTKWTCLLCQEINPLPPGTYSFFRANDLKIANRLLLEIFCQVDASLPFRRPIRNSSCSRSVCLFDIKSNLSKGKYVNIWDFIRDVKSMFANCYLFRQAEVDVVLHAQSLEEIFNRLLMKFIPNYS